MKKEKFFFILVFALFTLTLCQQATSNAAQKQNDLYLEDYFARGNTRDQQKITEEEAMRQRANQNRQQNADNSATDNFWNQLNFGDYLASGNKLYQGQIDEIDTGRDRTQLAARRNTGTSDQGRIQYQENQFNDRGNDYEDSNENVKQNKNRFAGTLENNANLKGTGAQDFREIQKAQSASNSPGHTQSSLLNDYGARDAYTFDNNFGNFLGFEDSYESFEGQKNGKKISNYDKSGSGKKLDHIYDKQTWDNSDLIYDNDKIYQKVKSTKVIGLENQNVADKQGNQNQGEDHSRSSSASDIGSSNSEQEGYQNKKTEKNFNQDFETATKILKDKNFDYTTYLGATPSSNYYKE